MLATLPPVQTAAPSDGLASIEDAAKYLRVGRTTVYELMKEELPSVRIGTRRLIPWIELRRFLNSRLDAA